jgi:hypothetical protein
MRRFLILICCCFVLASCSKVETAANEKARPNPIPTASASPTVETNSPLKPVVPNVKLNSKQKKYLNESLPPEAREILEKAENFEVLAESYPERQLDEGRDFEPNRIAKISDENDKKKILEAFYRDAAEEDAPAVCYEPHHALRATYKGKTVEVEICFSCSRFVLKGVSGEVQGTIVRENRRSEDVFRQIIESQSIEIKQ